MKYFPALKVSHTITAVLKQYAVEVYRSKMKYEVISA